MNKKLQVFVSATFIDLEKERQVAVKSILESGHIPAGMELFTANSDEHWEIIKSWIDNSDVYLLIFGGRYRSINDKTQLSYTEMEYDYAIETNKPIISIVLSDKYLNSIADTNMNKQFERESSKYITFKKKVYSKMVKTIDKIESMDSSILKAILEIEKNEDIHLTGWLRGDFSKIDSKFKIGELSFNEINDIMRKKVFRISEKFWDNIGKEISGIQAYYFLKQRGGALPSTHYDKNSVGQYMYDYICPYFISLGLLESKKVVGKEFNETRFTRHGIKFNQLQEKFKKE